MRGTGGLERVFGEPADWGGVGVSPVRYAESMELLWPGTIAAHLATGVSEEDIEILARASVACRPLSPVERVPRLRGLAGAGDARAWHTRGGRYGRPLERPEHQPLRGDALRG